MRSARSPFRPQFSKKTSISPAALLLRIVKRTASKFSPCCDFQHCLELTLRNKRNWLRLSIKEWTTGEEESMERYLELGEGRQELQELTEYYKYYTQTAITHLPETYRLMHAHRERRKAVEYQRLKVILNLSHSTRQDTAALPNPKHHITPASSFHLLQQLTFTHPASEESLFLAKLHGKLQKQMGPNLHPTIEELDRNYHFSTQPKRKSREVRERGSRDTKDKGYQDLGSTKTSLKKRKNGSCESLVALAKGTPKRISRKKQQSMDNLGQTASGRRSNERKLSQERDKGVVIKEKIMDMKEKIQKEKEKLKRKAHLDPKAIKKPPGKISRPM